jgi:hypothetical protein
MESEWNSIEFYANGVDFSMTTKLFFVSLALTHAY